MFEYSFYFNLGLNLGAVPRMGTLVLLHLPLLGFCSFAFLFFVLYYKYTLYTTRGVPNKSVEITIQRKSKAPRNELMDELN